MLHEVRRCTSLVAGVVCSKSRDRRRSIVLSPSAEHAVALVASGIGDAPEVGLEFLVIIYIHTADSLEEHREVEVLVAELYVQTPVEVGYRIENPSLVIGVYRSALVEVSIFQTADTCVRLSGSLHFLFVLIESFHHVAHD